jgi:endonuclease-8
LTRFEHGWTIYSHNQLYGRWYVVSRDAWPETKRTLRILLRTPSHSALLFSASDIQVLHDSELSTHPFLSKIGPDILDSELELHQIHNRLLEEQFRRRSLAALYLDQGFLAGVGNYLRSEILHEARVNPRHSPAKLNDDELSRLAKSTLVISRRSYRTAGVTNAPARVKQLKNSGVSRPEYRFAVFGREGLPCYRCASTLRRVQSNARRLYYCPACQQGDTG